MSVGSQAFPDNGLTIYVETPNGLSNWYISDNSSYNTFNWNSDEFLVTRDCTLSEDKTYVVSISGTGQNLNTPYRQGYTFGGWSLTEGGTTADYTAANVNTASGGATLYVIWTAN